VAIFGEDRRGPDVVPLSDDVELIGNQDYRLSSAWGSMAAALEGNAAKQQERYGFRERWQDHGKPPGVACSLVG
jgi:hypothetical protein